MRDRAKVPRGKFKVSDCIFVQAAFRIALGIPLQVECGAEREVSACVLQIYGAESGEGRNGVSTRGLSLVELSRSDGFSDGLNPGS